MSVHPYLVAALRIEDANQKAVDAGELDVEKAMLTSCADLLILAMNPDEVPDEVRDALLLGARLHAFRWRYGLHAAAQLDEYSARLEAWDGTVPTEEPTDEGNPPQ